MNTAIERFVRFHKHLQLTEMYPGRSVLEERLGVSNGYITKAFAKKSAMGSDLIKRISELFPQLNLVWLITGNETMLNQEQEEHDEIDNNDVILKLQEELKEAYMEIGRLNMELKSAKEHNSLLRRG